MATNSLQSLHLYLHHHSDTYPSAFSSFFLKPTSPSTTTISVSSTTTLLSQTASTAATPFALSSSTTTPSTSQAISYDVLQQHLSSKDYRQADEETRRLLIVLAGEAAVTRGYVFFSEVQFIPEADLKAIDELWRQHSNNRFGYSVQRRIWEKVNKDFTRFFLKVGWMKKLDTEVEQYNYRSFPTEFMWELTDDTPEGHLPLTNALRGTQLLNCILSHPAFQGNGEGEDEENVAQAKDTVNGGLGGFRDGSKPLSDRGVFKPDYSF